MVIVVVGFAPTLFLRSFSELQSLPVHLHFHGAVLTSWFVWLIVQTSAIRSGNIAAHRKLGIVGSIIGGACVIAGPLATMGIVRSLRAAGLNWDTDMSAYPVVGIEGIPMEQFATQIVFTNFGSILTFGGLLAFAIFYRKHASTHKRLILLASISIIGPPLARISRWPWLGGEDGAFIPTVFFGLLLMLFAYDLITIRRVHRVTWIGTMVTVLILTMSMAMSSTPFGSTLVRAMT